MPRTYIWVCSPQPRLIRGVQIGPIMALRSAPARQANWRQQDVVHNMFPIILTKLSGSKSCRLGFLLPSTYCRRATQVRNVLGWIEFTALSTRDKVDT